jgi:type IV pilus assembly protein PilX
MRQRGVALLVVMVMVMLATLLVIGAARTAWFNELLVGIEADHQRAFENAQALLRDAELDIQNSRPDGTPCSEGRVDEIGCRPRGVGRPWFPREGPVEFQQLRTLLASRQPSCMQGICVVEQVKAEFWLTADELERMKASAARYGEFTAAQAGNPLLASKAWYWVEVLPFNVDAPLPPDSDAMAPDADHPYIYRITALAEGRKPATRALLQALFVWKKVDS